MNSPAPWLAAVSRPRGQRVKGLCRAATGLQGHGSTVVTRTRWSNGPRSRLADPESGGVPDVDSQQDLFRKRRERLYVGHRSISFHSFYIGCESGRRQVCAGCHTGDTNNPTGCVAVPMARRGGGSHSGEAYRVLRIAVQYDMAKADDKRCTDSCIARSRCRQG